MDQMTGRIRDKIFEGGNIDRDEALEIAREFSLDNVLALSNGIREHFKGNNVDLCSIMNAKSGKCSEDCKYCAQSGRYSTGVDEYPLVSGQDAVSAALANEKEGVKRFSLVISGLRPSDSEFQKILSIYHELKDKTKISLCASLGCLTKDQAIALKGAGIKMYHHNVETSRNYFPKICGSHSYDDRIRTIRAIQEAGLDVCSGGIIGMGETMEDRIDMALELRELGVKSIPVNILMPIAGTPLGKQPILQPEEILRSVALFRIINPSADIRYAGGRKALGEYQALGYQAGISAALVGNFLTTVGNTISQDIELIVAQGLRV